MSYFKKTLSNLSWMGVLKAATRAVTFVRLAILARLLSPMDFGFFGIATLIISFLEIVTETGINVFFIQGEGELAEYIDTAWVVSIIRGILMAGILFTTAPIISSFFNSPEAINIIRFASLVPLIRGFINPSEIAFQKNLHFNKEFYFRFAIFALDSTTAVISSFISKSAIGLIYGVIAGGLLEVILSFVFINPKPKIKFDISKIKHVIHRGKWVTFARLLYYIFTSGDNITVGRILGSSSLGLYDMAYKISMIPLSEIGDVFGQVLFPTFSHLGSDKHRLRKAYLKVVVTLTIITLPIGLILFFFTYPIVSLVLGVKWLSIIPTLQLLSFIGVVRAVTGSSSALFYALKKQEYVTKITILNMLGLGVPIIPLVHRFGFYGAGIAAGIGTIIALPLIGYYLYKELLP